jgi:hypothetical protein
VGPKLSKGLETAIKGLEKPVLVSNGVEMVQSHADFYHSVLEEALV